jgi:DNA-directed RNA polymerase subunit M/transcription elongation factor TFIIS
MEFCPNCEKVLQYREGIGYQCPKCGYTTDNPIIETDMETPEIIEKDLSPIVTLNFDESPPQTPSTATVNCPLCTNNKAFYWTHAVGTDDDVELIYIFRCTQCGHRWHQEE